MVNLIKKVSPVIIFIACFFLASTALFGENATLVQKYTTSNGVVILRINLNTYFANIYTSFGTFSNSVNKYSALTLQFDNVINTMISILNCLICLLNTFLIPLSLLSCVLTTIFSIIGFPANETNFLYNIFNTINTLQVQYVNYI